MEKHVVFLIHGIGLHVEGWGEELNGPVQTLKTVAKRYSYFKEYEGDRLNDNVEFVSVQYDTVFKDTIQRWKTDAKSVTDSDPNGSFKEGLGWLASASDKDFWWSHLADLAMYRCF